MILAEFNCIGERLLRFNPERNLGFIINWLCQLINNTELINTI